MNIFRLSVILLLASALGAKAGSIITVTGLDDNAPLRGVTAIDNSGMIIGITDSHGAITTASGTDFPLTFSGIGYETATIATPTDTVKLATAVYQLPEVTIDPAERPITRVVCYAREYCSGTTSTDTLQMYSEYMTESFLAEGKVKGYNKYYAHLKPKARNSYARFMLREGGDSIARPGKNDDITALSFLEKFSTLPYTSFPEPEAIRQGAVTDTIHGKYGPQSIAVKTESAFMVTLDALSDRKGHKYSPNVFKLLGMTMDFEELLCSQMYEPGEDGIHDIYDLVSNTCSLRALCRGKMFKKAFHSKEPIALWCFVEVYPVVIERCSVDEFKEMRDDRSRTIAFKTPAHVKPLAPAVKRLVDRIDRELPR